MPLIPAEKQRRYRQKRDPDLPRREEYLQIERLRRHMLKASGKVNNVADLSERGKIQVRKYWRVTKQIHRKRQKETLNLVTLPNSPLQLYGNEAETYNQN